MKTPLWKFLDEAQFKKNQSAESIRDTSSVMTIEQRKIPQRGNEHTSVVTPVLYLAQSSIFIGGLSLEVKIYFLFMGGLSSFASTPQICSLFFYSLVLIDVWLCTLGDEKWCSKTR